MRRRALDRRPSPSAVAAVVVLAVFIVLAVAWQGLGGGAIGVETGRTLTAADLRALEIGSSRDDIPRAIGEGESALEDPVFGTTRTAVEPMDATCLYYTYSGRQNLRDLVQLCYRDDRLVSKRIYR